jgi:hypothetical protein
MRRRRSLTKGTAEHHGVSVAAVGVASDGGRQSARPRDRARDTAVYAVYSVWNVLLPHRPEPRTETRADRT